MSQIVVNTPGELADAPPLYREVLIHQLLAHTEGELSGGDHYQLMAPHAPNAYERKVIYEAAAEEMNHYLIGSKLLAEIGIDTHYMFTQSLDERSHYPSDFMHGTTWAERGLTSLLAEGAALEHIFEMAESSYRPLAKTCPVVMREEQRHVAHGWRITKKMCASDEGRAACQEVLTTKWPQVLDLFGRTGSRRSKIFLDFGLRKYSNEEARQRFVDKTRPKLESIGLEPPEDHLNRKFL